MERRCGMQHNGEGGPLRQALAGGSTLALAGMGKNAGKTTVLNALLRLLARDGKRAPALTSIGRDGETTDVVTGTHKPAIWVREGTLVATASGMLAACDVSREILGTTGMHTPLGEVIVLRTLSDGFVELAGPSMKDQLRALAAMLRELGGDPVLIDGAISRKSVAAPAVSEGVILCAGASYSPDMDATIADTAYAARLLGLGSPSGSMQRRKVLDGAATDTAVQRISPVRGDEVVVEDSSRILLPRDSFERWEARGVRFAVQRQSRLYCICVNPVSATGAGYDPAQFLARMRAATPVPVINVKEIQG